MKDYMCHSVDRCGVWYLSPSLNSLQGNQRQHWMGWQPSGKNVNFPFRSVYDSLWPCMGLDYALLLLGDIRKLQLIVYSY